MTHPSSSQNHRLRHATVDDAAMIRQLISTVHNNPIGLNWKRFILAIDHLDNLIGCGQVKPHRDGSYELASIAVLPEWRGQGIARSIITALLQAHPGTLYLTCQSKLGPMYQKFGFKPIQTEEMPAYFRRLSRMVTLFSVLSRQPNNLLVMRRN